MISSSRRCRNVAVGEGLEHAKSDIGIGKPRLDFGGIDDLARGADPESHPDAAPQARITLATFDEARSHLRQVRAQSGNEQSGVAQAWLLGLRCRGSMDGVVTRPERNLKRHRGCASLGRRKREAAGGFHDAADHRGIIDLGGDLLGASDRSAGTDAHPDVDRSVHLLQSPETFLVAETERPVALRSRLTKHIGLVDVSTDLENVDLDPRSRVGDFSARCWRRFTGERSSAIPFRDGLVFGARCHRTGNTRAKSRWVGGSSVTGTSIAREAPSLPLATPPSRPALEATSLPASSRRKWFRSALRWRRTQHLRQRGFLPPREASMPRRNQHRPSRSPGSSRAFGAATTPRLQPPGSGPARPNVWSPAIRTARPTTDNMDPAMSWPIAASAMPAGSAVARKRELACDRCVRLHQGKFFDRA